MSNYDVEELERSLGLRLAQLVEWFARLHISPPTDNPCRSITRCPTHEHEQPVDQPAVPQNTNNVQRKRNRKGGVNRHPRQRPTQLCADHLPPSSSSRPFPSSNPGLGRRIHTGFQPIRAPLPQHHFIVWPVPDSISPARLAASLAHLGHATVRIGGGITRILFDKSQPRALRFFETTTIDRARLFAMAIPSRPALCGPLPGDSYDRLVEVAARPSSLSSRRTSHGGPSHASSPGSSPTRS
ncbi:hypothetical protein CspHIS471_0100790 [Cutaneotrichosporon sp. HIS471]|nr:hypothetical protein CspHIS471_0100790 [Cutaneotrichosporon sp. HIS471]